MHVMEEQEHERPLENWVVADDAYWGGELSNDKRGRGSSNKTPFVAAVQLNKHGHPLYAKFGYQLKAGQRLTVRPELVEG